MFVTTQALKEKVLALPVAERLSLMEELWDSISSDDNAVPVPDAHRAILAERNAAHERDPKAVVSWADAKAEAQHRVRETRKQ